MGSPHPEIEVAKTYRFHCSKSRQGGLENEANQGRGSRAGVRRDGIGKMMEHRAQSTNQPKKISMVWYGMYGKRFRGLRYRPAPLRSFLRTEPPGLPYPRAGP